jgi:glycosyltransferase involved in cell wall biosynthesis
MVQDGETGVKFQAGDAEDLGRTIAELRRDPGTLVQMRRKARSAFLENYTPDRNFERLMSIYESVLAGRKGTMN